MTRAGTRLFTIMSSLILCMAAFGEDDSDQASNPYQGIVDRNVFALKPPPDPPSTEPPKPPMPKFILSGFATIPRKRAMMKATPAAKPGQQPKEESYYLAEGERDGDLEVLQIDAVARTVKVVYAGTTVVLDFTNNGAKATAAPAPPAGAPGTHAPPPPSGGPGGPGGNNPGFHAPNLPARPMRATGGAPMPNQPSAGGGFAPTGAAPYAGGAAAQATQAQPAAPSITKEQQELIMEAMREENRNNPEFPPLPPTSLTPLIQSAPQEGAPVGAPMTQPGPPGFPSAPPRPF